MRYTKEKCAMISFPLGGIGSGCIGLAGNGSLIDWEIFNHPDKGRANGFTHFAVRVEDEEHVLGVRILNGDRCTPFVGDGSRIGYGPESYTYAGWPHFPDHEFDGTFPVAKIDFRDDRFPGRYSMTAWSVMIPGESRDSSLPAAFFEFDLENNTGKTLTFTTVGALGNPWGYENTCRYNRVNGNQLTVDSGDGTGDLTLTLLDDLEHISWQTCFLRGAWQDPQEAYFNDLMRGGRFADRKYDCPPPNPNWETGLLADHITLAPAEHRKVCFILTWNIPEHERYWPFFSRDIEERVKAQNIPCKWKNYYATQWRDSADSGKYAAAEYERLRRQTFQFRDALFSGNVPDVVKDAVSGCIAVLKSPTCLRLEDGTFYGWEGSDVKTGSCEGSCTHVWGYQQALPFLFPDLERSMREAHLRYSVDKNGGSHFRLYHPMGLHAETSDFRPCADGQFGDVMKIYRDWLISGDDEYIRRWWPTIKRTIEYAWSPENQDHWDPGKTGILQGRQHHTLDMELFGPNAWLSGHYLGALDAAAKMADFAGDSEFAIQCREIRSRGEKWFNENLFNGEYFCQQTDLKDRSKIKDFPATITIFGEEDYWDDESAEIKYQIADGCGIDAHLPQLYASLYGLDPICEADKLRSTLQSIYRYNFKSVRDVSNYYRVFSLNDEKGVLICTWPRGTKPAIPLTYHSETMTGFEYAFAAHLAWEGFTDQAIEVVTAIRDRFDGQKRNPWNEFECGNNYARCMTSYALLLALSGFRYDRRKGMLGFAPGKSDYSGFWGLGELWGTFSQKAGNAELTLLHGEFELKKLELSGKIKSIRQNNTPATLPLLLREGDTLAVELE